MDFDTFTARNPDNKYDDGKRDRFTLFASKDDMVINLIGRGVLVGEQEVLPGTVQPENESWIGKKDFLFMLDGGGHAWYHEVPHYTWEPSEKAYEKLVGTRRIIKVPPNHSVNMTI